VGRSQQQRLIWGIPSNLGTRGDNINGWTSSLQSFYTNITRFKAFVKRQTMIFFNRTYQLAGSAVATHGLCTSRVQKISSYCFLFYVPSVPSMNHQKPIKAKQFTLVFDHIQNTPAHDAYALPPAQSLQTPPAKDQPPSTTCTKLQTQNHSPHLQQWGHAAVSSRSNICTC
jgi:hypothetical protein